LMVPFVYCAALLRKAIRDVGIFKFKHCENALLTGGAFPIRKLYRSFSVFGGNGAGLSYAIGCLLGLTLGQVLLGNRHSFILNAMLDAGRRYGGTGCGVADAIPRPT
jgi:hypothetical protein